MLYGRNGNNRLHQQGKHIRKNFFLVAFCLFAFGVSGIYSFYQRIPYGTGTAEDRIKVSKQQVPSPIISTHINTEKKSVLNDSAPNVLTDSSPNRNSIAPNVPGGNLTYGFIDPATAERLKANARNQIFTQGHTLNVPQSSLLPLTTGNSLTTENSKKTNSENVSNTPSNRKRTSTDQPTTKQSEQSEWKMSKLTIDVVNIDLSELLKTIAAQTGLNLVLSEGDMAKKVTIVVKSEPLESILKKVCFLGGISYKIEDNSLFVYPNIMEPAAPIVNVVKTVLIKHRLAGEMLATVSPVGDKIGDVSIIEDKTNNGLVISGNEEKIKIIEEMIKNNDTDISQVVMDVMFCEFRKNNNRDTGLEWAWDPLSFVEFNPEEKTSDSNNSELWRTFQYGYVGRKPWEFEATLKAAVGKGYAKVLNSTRLIVRSGQKATLSNGDDSPIITWNKENGTQTDYKKTGVQLEIEPTIVDADKILININPAFSEVPGYVKSEHGQAPIISERSVNTTLVLKSGQWFVISGLIKDKITENNGGIPGLMSIPLIGELFKNQSKTTEQIQTVMLIRPSLVRQHQNVPDDEDDFSTWHSKTGLALGAENIPALTNTLAPKENEEYNNSYDDPDKRVKELFMQYSEKETTVNGKTTKEIEVKTAP